MRRGKDTFVKIEAELEKQVAELEKRIRSLESARAENSARSVDRTSSSRNVGASVSQVSKQDVKPIDAFRNSSSHGNKVFAKSEDGDSILIEEFGRYKINVVALVKRIKAFFAFAEPSNSKFTRYLATGSIEGPPLLRREKRIVRLRFFLTVGFVLLVIIGVVLTLWR